MSYLRGKSLYEFNEEESLNLTNSFFLTFFALNK